MARLGTRALKKELPQSLLRLESTFRFLHRQLHGSFLFSCVCPSLELHSLAARCNLLTG